MKKFLLSIALLMSAPVLCQDMPDQNASIVSACNNGDSDWDRITLGEVNAILSFHLQEMVERKGAEALIAFDAQYPGIFALRLRALELQDAKEFAALVGGKEKINFIKAKKHEMEEVLFAPVKDGDREALIAIIEQFETEKKADLLEHSLPSAQ